MLKMINYFSLLIGEEIVHIFVQAVTGIARSAPDIIMSRNIIG